MRKRKPIATVTWYEESGMQVARPFYDHGTMESFITELGWDGTVYFVCMQSLSHPLPTRTSGKHRRAM